MWGRRWRRRLGGLVLLVILLAVLAYLRPAEQLVAADGERVHVMDGDTLRIGARIVRLADMDAVELHQSCQTSDGARWLCGQEARSALEALVARGGLRCESRTSDRFGRAIATCSVDGVSDVSADLVAQGWAVSGDVRRAGIHAAREREAREAGRGIWRGTFDRPDEWRAAHPREDRP